jgi:hypothetical protein
MKRVTCQSNSLQQSVTKLQTEQCQQPSQMGITFGDGGFFGAPKKNNQNQSGQYSPRGIEYQNSSP